MEIDGQTGQSQENRPEGGRSGRGRGVMHSWLRDLVVSVVASALIIIFLYQPVRVEGTSILAMLEDQDRLFVNKLACRGGVIHRGYVVWFFYSLDHVNSYVNRAIAVPGYDMDCDH